MPDIELSMKNYSHLKAIKHIHIATITVSKNDDALYDNLVHKFPALIGNDVSQRPMTAISFVQTLGN